MCDAVIVRGTGSIGMRHAEVLRGAGRRVLLFPKTPERLQQLRTDGWDCVDTWESGRHEGAKLAIVATNTALHPADTLAALAAGFERILVEKPLASGLEEATPLLSLPDEDQSRIFCGMTLRHTRGLRAFRDQLPGLRAVHAVSITCRSWLPGWRPSSDYRRSYSASTEEGGVLRDLIHEIDYALWLFGSPEEVSADLINTGRLGMASDEIANLQFRVVPAGPCVQIGLDYLGRPPVRRVDAWGEAGSLHWDAIRQEVCWRPIEGKAETNHHPEERNEGLHREQQVLFADPRPEDVPLKEALLALAVCDAARKSSYSRKAMPLSFSPLAP